MARARNIKPALFKNEVLGAADPLHTILFIGLWTLADRNGRLEDRPLRIKAEVFPYREGIDANAMLDWLQAEDFILRYIVDGKGYIQVKNFDKHQNPHKNEQASDLPGPGGENSGPQKGGREASAEVMARFEAFWQLYPRKASKDASRKAWAKLAPDAELMDRIMESLAKHCASRDWIKDDGQFIPHASTWLNQKRWEDEVRPAGNVTPISRHHGFDKRDYTTGLTEREDGTYGF